MLPSIEARRAALRDDVPTWRPRTLHETFQDTARRYGDRPLVLTDDRILTYAQADDWVAALADGLAAMVSAADMVAHYTNGESISPDRLMASCERIGLGPEALRDLLYELPLATADSGRISEPCPLSARELDVLRHLSEGMVYKQIATEMHLSVSTIRTHLHNVYGKIGAVDRAQAVLTARDRGWI